LGWQGGEGSSRNALHGEATQQREAHGGRQEVRWGMLVKGPVSTMASLWSSGRYSTPHGAQGNGCGGGSRQLVVVKWWVEEVAGAHGVNGRAR
jgi:hypothetical protein